MMMRKRIDNGSNCFQVPSIPRAPRSNIRRSPHKKFVKDECAFELLASLAGKLLESEGSSSSCNASERKDEPAVDENVIKQEQEDVKPIKTQYIDHGTHDQGGLVSHMVSQNIDKLGCGLKSEIFETATVFENSVCKIEAGSPNYGESCIGSIGNGIGREQKAGDMAVACTCSIKGPEEFSEKNPDSLKLSSNGKPPLCMDPRNGVSLGNRDDDEKTYSYSKPLSKVKSSRPSSRIGDRRIRKLLTSKYWKVAPRLKDCEVSNTDGGVKPVYSKRKTSCHHDIPYKKRKLFYRSSVVASGGRLSSESVSNSPSESVSNSPEKGINDTYRGVKFSIKSFTVPEIFIEVPETTTVGSLKRTVMDAVTTILGGGLRVGIVLQGKKIRDDSRTLLQTGISGKDNLDDLGFSLEPNAFQAPPTPTCPRSLAAPVQDLEVFKPVDPFSSVTLGDQLESKREPVTSHTNILTDHAKPRRPELGQRRTRRPFSVTEVEALVEAIEWLGTGRWRDVKLCAFEDADHRTYVDLKDKWKTLVHTAKIAPQQRRGEPVPQELLDRVLAAHSYWSDQKTREATQVVMDTVRDQKVSPMM